MNLHQINLVQTTFVIVTAKANLFVTQLYDHLFRLDPCLCYLFPKEMEDHKEEFMIVLTEIVAGLERPYSLIQNTLKPLGRKHASYKIQPAHYHIFATALRRALAQAVGDTFTDEVEAAWIEAYYLAVSVIREANSDKVCPP